MTCVTCFGVVQMFQYFESVSCTTSKLNFLVVMCCAPHIVTMKQIGVILQKFFSIDCNIELFKSFIRNLKVKQKFFDITGKAKDLLQLLRAPLQVEFTKMFKLDNKGRVRDPETDRRGNLRG
ncbi:MAG: hypothetical protein Q8Q60_05625 [Candidatus Chromulinivorax sp.]|nr:hypothetical protein [Candidatus Chromulinivorax sp.]